MSSHLFCSFNSSIYPPDSRHWPSSSIVNSNSNPLFPGRLACFNNSYYPILLLFLQLMIPLGFCAHNLTFSPDLCNYDDPHTYFTPVTRTPSFSLSLPGSH